MTEETKWDKTINELEERKLKIIIEHNTIIEALDSIISYYKDRKAEDNKGD